MTRVILLIVPLMLGFIAAGCSAEKMATADQSIQRVSISNSEDFGGGHQDFIWTSDSQEDREVFEQLITSAEKENISVNQPVYDATINYGDGEKGGERLIHLAEMNNGQYALMYAGHEDETYLADDHSSEKIKNLLP